LNGDERAIRVKLVLDHFISGGYGADVDVERQRIFLNDTMAIPIEDFKPALRLARQTITKDGVVPVSAVIYSAIQIRQRRDPEKYQNQNGGMSTPRWHQRMLKGQFPEDSTLITAGHRTKEIPT